MGQAFRSAVEARDLDLMRDALHPQVRFSSPVVHKPYEGRDEVMHLLSHVIEVFEAFRYTDELTGVGSCGLVFKAKVGDKEVQGWDFLQLDSAGLVTHLTVMVRPLSGLVALAEAMATRLAAAT